MSDLAGLCGLGPKSAEMLLAAGIANLEELREAGAVVAFLRVQQTGCRPSKNLLWALYGALHDKAWNALTIAERDQLLNELSRLTGDGTP